MSTTARDPFVPGAARTGNGRIRTALTPTWVSRVNLFPYLALSDPDRVAADEHALEQLAGLERLRAELADEVQAELTELVEVDRERASRDWLPLRRAVRAGRRPKDRQVDDPTLRQRAALSAWLDSWQRQATLLADLDGSFDTAVARERLVVTAWAQDEDVQRSTVMTSRSLFRAVRSRAGAVDGLTKRQRKSESSLVTYVGRSTSKVSPFSRYTGTAFHQLDESAGAMGEEHRSVVALRRLLVRQAARRLAQDPVARRALSWRVSDAVRSEGDVLVVHRRDYVTQAASKSDVVSESDVRLPLTGSWGAVWAVVRAASGRPWTELAQALTDRFGWGADRADDILAALVDLQALTPDIPIIEQEPDYLSRWAEFLRDVPGEAAATMVTAVQAGLEGECRLAAAPAVDRFHQVERTEAAWSVVLGEPVENPFAEDCYAATGAPADGARVRTWAQQLDDLAPMLVVMDDQRLLAAALEATFVDHFGAGGTCHDLRRFARQAYDTFPLTQQLLAGAVPEPIRHIVQPLLEARAIVADHLVELGRSGGEAVSVDLDELDRAADRVPDREWDLSRSTTAFGQPAGEQFVLNHLYGGRARYFSRFLAEQPAQVQEQLRQVIEQGRPDGARHLHLRPALGFNANLGPLLTEDELRLTDEPAGPYARWSIDDLALVHRPSSGLRLVHRSSGEPVEVLYTGFLVPHALPSEEMLLAMVSGAPYFSFSELTLDLHARLQQLPSGASSTAPRIQHRDLLLFRRRWAVSTEDLLPGAVTDPAERYRAVTAARLGLGLPGQVFARPLFGRQVSPMERAMSARPQLLDLGSRLHVSSLHRRLEPLGTQVLVEEYHPHPSAHGVPSPRGRHATELFFEIALAPGGHR